MQSPLKCVIVCFHDNYASCFCVHCSTCVHQAAADDYTEEMSDPDFLQEVLANLPGVDPNSQEIQSAMSQLTKKQDKKDDNEDKGSQ